MDSESFARNTVEEEQGQEALVAQTEILKPPLTEEASEVSPTEETSEVSPTEEPSEDLELLEQNSGEAGSDDGDSGDEQKRELTQEEEGYYRGFIEAILFLSNEPLSLGILAKRCELDRANTRKLVDYLVDDYVERDGGVLLREIAGGYQFITSDRYGEALRNVYKDQKKETLSRSTLETLAIICYRQPVTLPEIEEIRGVNSRSMITTLLARKFIKPQGYRPVPGRPTLYVTTRQFLTHFALNTLADLPTLEEVKELKFDDIE